MGRVIRSTQRRRVRGRPDQGPLRPAVSRLDPSPRPTHPRAARLHHPLDRQHRPPGHHLWHRCGQALARRRTDHCERTTHPGAAPQAKSLPTPGADTQGAADERRSEHEHRRLDRREVAGLETATRTRVPPAPPSGGRGTRRAQAPGVCRYPQTERHSRRPTAAPSPRDRSPMSHSAQFRDEEALLSRDIRGGADGNRTRAVCLGSRSSAIELQPQSIPQDA